MNCSICLLALNPYIRDTLLPGEESTDFVVQYDLSPDREDAQERLATFKKEGFWAASLQDAEIFTGQTKGAPVHDVISADSGKVLRHGTHSPVPT